MKRHNTLERFERWLGHISRGRAAQGILDAGDLPTRGVLVVLPHVAWCPGPVALKKSTHGALPHQLMWSGGRKTYGTVAVLPSLDESTLTWTMSGFGQRQQGTMTVRPMLGAPELEITDVDCPPETVTASTMRKSELVSRLNALVADGNKARFELILHFDASNGNRGGSLSEEVRKAERRVAYDVHRGRNHGEIQAGEDVPLVLDPSELEVIRDELQLGYIEPTETTDRLAPESFPAGPDGAPQVPDPESDVKVRPDGARLFTEVWYTIETDLQPSTRTTVYAVYRHTRVKEERLGTVDKAIAKYSSDKVRPAVDFIRYVKTALRRDAEQSVRRHIGDPWVGRKVRDFALQHPHLSTTDELIAAYNRRHPRDPLGRTRAEQALNPTPRLKTVPLNETMERTLSSGAA